MRPVMLENPLSPRNGSRHKCSRLEVAEPGSTTVDDGANPVGFGGDHPIHFPDSLRYSVACRAEALLSEALLSFDGPVSGGVRVTPGARRKTRLRERPTIDRTVKLLSGLKTQSE